jgi:hypothetical protein
MTKKKRKVSLKDLPDVPPARHDGFETGILSNKELRCAVKTGMGLMCSIFDPQKVRSEFDRKIREMLTRLFEGQRTDLVNPGAGAYAVMGSVEPKFADNYDLAVRIGHYADTAWRFYMDAIVSKLEELPEQLAMQVMLATITEMEIDGVLKFEQDDGVTTMWNSYLDSLVEKIGNEWNKPKRGAKRDWSPIRRRLLLEYYEARLEEFTWIKETYEANKKGDWLKKVGEKYPDMKVPTLKRVKLEEPEDIARELALKFLNKRGDEGFAKQLRLAQKEREAREKAREEAENVREVDLRNMYALDFVHGFIRPRNLSYKKS